MISYLKREKLLVISALLAIISTFFIHPDIEYLDYIDVRVLVLLYCLMVIVKGFQDAGLFDVLVKKLTSKLTNARSLCMMLVFSCFFFGMFITNDVALITFVPFAIFLLSYCNLSEYMIQIIVLQTVAANLGSMATPVGNPQNLYLFSISTMSTLQFEFTILPYVIISFIMLFLLCFIVPKAPVLGAGDLMENTMELHMRHFLIYLILFIVMLLTVLRILPYIPVFALIILAFLAIKKGWILLQADFALLFTFVFLFVFVGNIGRIEVISSFISNILIGREVIFATVCSQFLSNVPAAMLLSGFTEDIPALVIGTNIGGLGTIIASMASIISFKAYSKTKDSNVKKYLFVFTLFNLVGLFILLSFYFLIRS